MEKDKRRYQRFSVDSMKINGKILFSKVVDILDISLGGMSLKTDRRLNIGSEYTLKINENGKFIPIKGSVVWASLHESVKSANGDLVPIYAVGMKFNDGWNENISELIEFIVSHMHREQVVGEVRKPGDLRFYLRFHVGDGGKAVLTSPESYAIRSISMGGMRIEAGNAMNVEEPLPMEISLPENDSINFLARVVSCNPIHGEDSGRYSIGIEFLNMAEDHSRILERFLNMLS